MLYSTDIATEQAIRIATILLGGNDKKVLLKPGQALATANHVIDTTEVKANPETVSRIIETLYTSFIPAN